MPIPRAAGGHVLALDLATATGWAGGSFGARPRCGTINLAGQTAAARMSALQGWLDDFQRVSGAITALVVEAAILMPSDTVEKLDILLGLRAAALLWAYDSGIPDHLRVSYRSDSVRAHMLGSARFPKGEAKQRVISWCLERGFNVRDDNAADALLTWHYAEALTNGTPRATRGLAAA